MAEATTEDKIRQIVVIPSSVDVSEHHVDGDALKNALRTSTELFRSKTEESKQTVSSSSPVSFMANAIQTRLVSTELCTSLTRVYEALDVRKVVDFDQKIQTLKESPPDEETAKLLEDFSCAVTEWEAFLSELDAEVDKVAGPSTGLGPADDIQLATKGKTVQSGTLLTYVKTSAYEMLYIQVVTSFSNPEAADLILKSYGMLTEFQALSCDILLLTKGSGGEGSGFLKLVGVPFRMLLDEQESLNRILQHRQSAISLAGIRALHLFTEMITNDETFDVSRSDSESGDIPGLSALGGCILVDRSGHVLYNYVCTDNSNWPDAEVILEQVKIHRKVMNEEHAHLDTNKNTESTIMSSSTTKDEKEMNVAVMKKKCCTIL